MWYLLQGLIIFAVVATNIHWNWTPNGYLAAGLGTGIALVVTLAANDIVELRARKKRRERRQRRTLSCRKISKPLARNHKIGLRLFAKNQLRSFWLRQVVGGRW